ncbi:hypothetical protein CTI12_AA074570 [Artemisia annua]|uniref:Uncharacterized protein n=1 Tax=Artemisia annua TaxID=35608 RepID=A0A2U1Q4Z0_ARTAN|nr:hypothetical protein CTI12_AA074570 [Artemisia annua]
MGASTKERGVLKLVHPGKHVEYHRRSITASEIMKKNPRHSITRPDFFKNPDIVLSPESIMVPGQVFYIVPNTTVHRLVKDKSQQLIQPFLQQTKSLNTSDNKVASTHSSPSKLWAGTTPMYHFHSEQEGSSSCAESRPQVEETDEGCVVNNLLDDSLSMTFQAKDYYLNRNWPAWGLTTDSCQQQRRSNTKAKNLKSCMKKEGGIRVSSNLRVTFDFTTMIQY